MVSVIRNDKLKWFSVYVFILGAVLIPDQFVLHMIVKYEESGVRKHPFSIS